MKIIGNFAILALLWSLYYLAMRGTGGVLTAVDLAVCGTVILLSILVTAVRIYRYKKGR